MASRPFGPRGGAGARPVRLGYAFFPRFPVQRRVKEAPALTGQPLVLAREHEGARRVEHASSAAMAKSIRPGLTVGEASSRHPPLLVLPYHPPDEAKALLALGEGLLEVAPAFQVDAPWGLWLDASASPLFGGEAGWLEAVRARCEALGYQAQVAVASEPFTAQVVAASAPATVVLPGESGAALAPLPLHSLGRSGRVDEAQVGLLRALGIATLGELAGLPSGAITARYGAAGVVAAQLARGEDDRRFVADVLPERIEEVVTLDWPAESLEPVLFAAKAVLDRVAARLQGRGLAAVRLTVTLQTERSGAGVAPWPLRLARPSAQAKLLLELVRARLGEVRVPAAVVGVRVWVDEASRDEARQLRLDEAPHGEAELEVVLSRLSSALGPEVLRSPAVVAQHRPEHAFEAVAFAPPRAGGAGRGGDSRDPVLGSRPTRLLPAPQQVEVVLDAQGQLSTVQLLGRRRAVEGVWGPERLAGEWWSQTPFARDYYRVQLREVGSVWMYRDGQSGWFFVQGLFD